MQLSRITHWKYWALAIISAVFFFSYFFLHGTQALHDIKTHTMTHVISNQPDEIAHYFFIKELVVNQSFGAVELLNGAADNQIHPRSMTVVGQRLQPIGFPFFILLVSIFSLIPKIIFGVSFFNLAVITLVPLLAVCSNFLLYEIVRKLWNERMAFIVSLLLFLLPPWWYWSTHPFQYSIPFVFFIILSLYSIIRISDTTSERSKLCFVVLSALGLASALALRPNELVWVFGVYTYSLYLTRTQWTKRLFGAWVVAVACMMLLFFVVQDAFYGAPFGSGYVKPLSSGEAGNALMGGQGVSFLRAFFFPFGIHITTAFVTAYRYFFLLFNPWTLWTFVSCLFIIFRGDRVIRKYFLVWALISLYLVIWYGSWNFSDNLLGIPSIGSSQIRYFMPIYVGMIPLVAYFADQILQLLPRRKKIFAIIVLGLLFSVSSYHAVYTSYPEGLARVRQTLNSYTEWQKRIYSYLPESAIVITRYGDKYIFPGRKVVIRDLDDMVWTEAVKKLSQLSLPIWWHDLKLSSEEEEKVGELLGAQGLLLGGVVDSWGDLELRPVVEK